MSPNGSVTNPSCSTLSSSCCCDLSSKSSTAFFAHHALGHVVSFAGGLAENVGLISSLKRERFSPIPNTK